MELAGICRSCRKPTRGLVSCSSCGSSVCAECIFPVSGFCRLCGGSRRFK